ncbi:MAG: DUF1194 domain-containing protein [Rhodobacteraceae bacterium]|nr:DUF1194 domain-containing protein [Paracoccaceae bacterium]MCP5341847.1 DUF1194 domain-containing protein [Paracoccaceae bacterium]
MHPAAPLILAGLLWAAPAAAACRLALLLALDVSASVDATEDGLQRRGLARALLAPEVESALLSQAGAPVALGVYEWSGRYNQDMLVNWTELRTRDDIARAALALSRSRRGRDDLPTALGYALGHAASLFRNGPKCRARTLDVSGDGPNNDGFPPDLAYRYFPLDGVTVNALAIGGADEGLADYYQQALIRGSGAFVERAANFEAFESAMRRKLLREVQIIIGMNELHAAGPARASY